MTSADDLVRALAVLDEPRRRDLYEHVTASEAPVGRDDAARALGITRELAAFHLDRLVDAGLLDVRYRRLNGRTGPGAGRPAKLYQRAARELHASYPPRQYGQAAAMLAAALERLGADGLASAAETARASGRSIGEAARAETRGHDSPAAAATDDGRADALVELLRRASFEPTLSPDRGTIRLRNCPYHALAAEHRDLTCGMNLAWAEGVLRGLGETAFVAELAPSVDACCVVFTRAESPA
jgi:predicted ArsR family transcriptional regulator